jgi:hypothetical protein
MTLKCQGLTPCSHAGNVSLVSGTDPPEEDRMAKDKPKGQEPKPTSGPYTWGNGPKPYGPVKRIIKKIQGK